MKRSTKRDVDEAPDNREDGTARFPIIPPGVWLESMTARSGTARPGLFLDRDGVIVEETEYLRQAPDVKLLPGAAEVIGRANRAGIPVAVVTNQSGIDRGLYGWPQFLEVQKTIIAMLNARGARIDAVAACPFHPDFTHGFGEEHARWRKPASGMLTALRDLLNLELSRSWLVGDKALDVEAAKNADLAGSIHLLSGHGAVERKAALALTDPEFRVVAADGLVDALKILKSVLPRLDEPTA